MIVNSRIYLKPGHVVGNPPETRIDVKVDHFPWSNCSPQELSVLISKLGDIYRMATAPRHNTPIPEDPE